MRIALIVDNPFRDLPGIVLVSMALCRAGAVCYLVPFNLMAQEIWALAPDFVLTNYLRGVNEPFVRKILDAGIQVGVLDTEGGVMSSVEAYGTSLAKDAKVRGAISCFFTWGAAVAEYAHQAEWFREEQIIVSGTPRFDYYVEPWRKAALANSAYVERYTKPLVLVNGSFSWANPQFVTPQQEAELLINQGFDAEHIRTAQSRQQETLLGLIALTNMLSARFPKVTFIYRPHPFESLKIYEEKLLPRTNLHLTKEGTVDGWVLRADAVIQRGCTTAIEAGVAGVPALSPSWLPTALDLAAPDAVSIACHSEEEICCWLNSIIAGQYSRPPKIGEEIEQVIRRWFHKTDGKAHQRIADAIMAHVQTVAPKEHLRQCRHFAYECDKQNLSLTTRCANDLRRLLNIPPDQSLRSLRRSRKPMSWDSSQKFFDAATVNRLLEELANLAAAKGKTQEMPLQAFSSQARGDYQLNQRLGRSVTVVQMQ